MADIDFTPQIDFTPDENLPVKQESGAGFLDRAVLKNLLDDSPKLQQEYLEKKGFQVRQQGGQMQIKKPKDKYWSVVDPEGFDLQDVTDVVGDIAEGALSAVGAIIGSSAGPMGSIAGAGAGAGLAETGKQVLGTAIGARPQIDAGRIATTAALGAAVPAAISGASAIAKPLVKLGQNAAGRALSMAPKKLMDIGPDKLRQLGTVARDKGLLDIFKGKEGAFKAAEKESQKVGKELSKLYGMLDDKIITRFKPKDLINRMMNQSSKQFPDPRSEKIIERELTNLLSTKKEVSPSLMWELAKNLDEKANTFYRSSITSESSKGGLLSETASNLRSILKNMAKAVDIPELAEKSSKYHTLKTIETALKGKWAGREGTSRIIDRSKAMDIVHDLINKYTVKVGKAAEPIAKVSNKAAIKAAPVGGIAERLSKLDEQ